MKHNKPFRSVFEITRYCGALIYTAKGWDAHDAGGKRVGCFEDDAKAAAYLRRGPRRLASAAR
jgi:hypothetical protein